MLIRGFNKDKREQLVMDVGKDLIAYQQGDALFVVTNEEWERLDYFVVIPDNRKDLRDRLFVHWCKDDRTAKEFQRYVRKFRSSKVKSRGKFSRK